MFSFKSLFLGALALGAVSSAAAAPLEGANILARCGCSSAAGVVTDLTASLSVHIDSLKYVNANNATVDVLRPVVGEITTAVSAAIVDITALVGQPAEVILASVDGTAQVTVQELAVLVGDLICLVFGALGAVLNVASGAALTLVLPLLITVGDVLGCFICLLFNVVGGVAGGLVLAVLALIGDVVGVITRLNVTMFISVLGLKL